jgi:hypothetical protein
MDVLPTISSPPAAKRSEGEDQGEASLSTAFFAVERDTGRGLDAILNLMKPNENTSSCILLHSADAAWKRTPHPASPLSLKSAPTGRRENITGYEGRRSNFQPSTSARRTGLKGPATKAGIIF